MSEILLINPSRKKAVAKKKSGKKLKHKAVKHVKRRKHRKMKKSHLPAVYTMKANKRRRVKRTTYLTNPSRKRRRVRHYLSNPISSPTSFIKHTLMPSAVGAAGALGLDVLMGLVPLPDMLKTPMIRPIVRIAGAVGIGMLASMVAGKKVGEQVAAGAITVTVYDVMKGLVQQFAPSLPLSGVDDYPYMGFANPGYPAGELTEGVGEYVGEYVGDADEAYMGEYVQ